MRTAISTLILSMTLSAASAAHADFASGWAWSSSETGTFHPSPSYSFNSKGGPITITNNSTGNYAVTFSGLNVGSTNGGNAQVVAYGPGNEYCNTGGWVGGGGDVTVFVSCFSANGNPINTRFVAGYEREANAYVWSGADPANPTAVVNYSHNDRGTTLFISHPGVGQYKVFTFEDFSATGGNPVVTAYMSNTHCKVVSWDPIGGTFNLLCFAPSGAPVDSSFSFTAGVHGAFRTTGHHFGYAFDQTRDSYPPPGGTPYAEDVVSFSRSGGGKYFTVHGSDPPGSSAVFVNASGMNTTYCKVMNWLSTGNSMVTVGVLCFDFSGHPADSIYIEQMGTSG